MARMICKKHGTLDMQCPICERTRERIASNTTEKYVYLVATHGITINTDCAYFKKEGAEDAAKKIGNLWGAMKMKIV